MDLLPPQKFAVRQWRFGRKRRRSGNEGAESEGLYLTCELQCKITKSKFFVCFFCSISGDSKIVKKDGETVSMDTSTTETPSTVAVAPTTTDTLAVAN